MATLSAPLRAPLGAARHFDRSTKALSGEAEGWLRGASQPVKARVGGGGTDVAARRLRRRGVRRDPGGRQAVVGEAVCGSAACCCAAAPRPPLERCPHQSVLWWRRALGQAGCARWRGPRRWMGQQMVGEVAKGLSLFGGETLQL